ncbi:MAG: hypothetical protein ACRYGR_02885 [Janthinobacterium lividum]
MKLKSVKKIRDEWCDSETGQISKESLEDLKKHLEGEDEDKLCRAISLVTDARLMQFVPLMAKHLDHEDDYIRELLIGDLLTILKLPEYAKVGLKMAQDDEDSGVRCLAVKGLGFIIDKADDQIKKEIFCYFCNVIDQDIYDVDTKQDVYRAMTIALDIPRDQRPVLVENPDLTKFIKPEIVQQFKEKYGFENKK